MNYSDFYNKVEHVIQKHSGRRDYKLEKFEEENSVILHCGRGLLHTSITNELYQFDRIIVSATWESDEYPLAISFTDKEVGNRD